MSDYIEQVFGNGGALARVIPGYVRRDGQIELARAIEDTISCGGALLGEAPCGTGKSMAYAVPAIVHAVRSRQRVLIVTANKALQDQLIEKDLPMLAKALADLAPFRFAIAKGRSNYLCQREFASMELASWPGCDDRDEVDALCAWRMITTTGDRSDAPAAVTDKLWRHVSVTPESCDRRACAYYGTCFVEKAAAEAMSVHVVVANYDLFYYKVLYGDAWLRRFNILVMDEAHEAADIARRCLGHEVNESTFRRLAKALSDRLGTKNAYEIAKRIRKVASSIFGEIAEYATKEQKAARLNAPGFVDASALYEVLDETTKFIQEDCEECEAPFGRGETDCKECLLRLALDQRVALIKSQLQEIIDQKDEDTAYWLDKPIDDARITGSNVKLCAAPYRVSDRLGQIFKRFRSVVGVSATLTSGGSFDYIKDELGLSSAHTLRVTSPFDFQQQAKFIIPLGIPFPVRENEGLFDAAVVEALARLIRDCRGRLLGLFTSWRRLKFVAEKLRDRVEYPLLCQGDAPNKALAQMFRETTDSVLLATRSFWMGLDVPGESLSCLVIDKLPFESFDDPIVDMMKTRHPETFFSEFYVPRAAITLAQGAGRLIRSQSDYGVFVLLDQRIKVHKYGQAFLRSLPFCGFSQDLADAGRFLDAVSRAA